MIYPNHFEEKIGFNTIRQLLADGCLSLSGRERVAELSFHTDAAWVEEQLRQSREFMTILTDEDPFPDNYFFDLRPSLERIRPEGTYLLEGEVFDLMRSLITLAAIISYLRRKDGENYRYPTLCLMTAQIGAFPEIIQRAKSLLDAYGEIKDSASLKLAEIRRELSSVRNSLSGSLMSILRQAKAEGWVEKDTQPTLRDGRLMIPASPAMKRKIKGIVHSESATGKTVFIEPSVVVDANNRIRELEADERRECIRLLILFTSRLRDELDDLLQSYYFLSLIDLIRSKSRLANEIGGIAPSVKPFPYIDWVEAYHPLLLLSHRKQQKEVVPLDLKLTEVGRILIISGPNAGGKSVCLKTAGLLQYMLQCGIPVPMKENSSVGLFEHIFIDIGDEQSIENDLSTYSSHLSHQKHFVRHADNKTLLLVDEFGGGTEPQIGGAIAESLLEQYNAQGAFGVITTHYHNLKHFADEHEGVINGAMLYDRHHMRPLFRLEIGRPGSSFAIEIARKIGLPEAVITSAKEKVGSDYIQMDKYLQDIVRDKRYWERKRDEVQQQRKRLEETTTRYETKLKQLAEDRQEMMIAAKMEAKELTDKANAHIERTIREIKESQAERERTRNARQALDAFKDELRNDDALSKADAITRKMQQLQERKKRKAERKEKRAKQASDTPSPTATPKPQATTLRIGTSVRIKGQTAVGKIIEVNKEKALVTFGQLQSFVEIKRLEPMTTQVNKPAAPTSQRASLTSTVSPISRQTLENMHRRKLQFKLELDIRGLRVDEALNAIIYYIDDAIMTGARQVRILHGTGTGALRQVVRDYLSGINQVRHYADEHVDFGGSGITVVELD